MGYSNDFLSRLGKLAAPQRNNYFYGKLLDEYHFQMEQEYHNQKRWMLNRLSLGTGVLCGLKVEQMNGQICVQPGVAIDGLGREIIVPERICIDPWQLTDDCGKPTQELARDTPHTIHLCLSYRECAADYQPVLVTNCNTQNQCAPGTTVESFLLQIREGLPTAPPAGGNAALCQALFGATATASGSEEHRITRTFDLNGLPVEFVASHDGKRLLIARMNQPFDGEFASITLQLLDSTTFETIREYPTDVEHKVDAKFIPRLSVAPDGGPAFFAQDQGVLRVNFQANEPQINWILQDKRYTSCAVAQKGEILYASVALDESTVQLEKYIFTEETLSSAIIGITADSFRLQISPDNRWLFIVGAEKIVRLNIETHMISEILLPPFNGNPSLAINSTDKTTIYVARPGIIANYYEDGSGRTIRPDINQVYDIRCSNDGRFLYVLNHKGGPNIRSTGQIVIFRTEDLREIERFEIGATLWGIAVTSTTQQVYIGKIDFDENDQPVSFAIIELERLTSTRSNSLCDYLLNTSPTPTDSTCLPLATIELSAAGAIDSIDNCSIRPILLNNAVLFDLILCLARRLEECCRTAPEPVRPVEEGGFYREWIPVTPDESSSSNESERVGVSAAPTASERTVTPSMEAMPRGMSEDAFSIGNYRAAILSWITRLLEEKSNNE